MNNAKNAVQRKQQLRQTDALRALSHDVAEHVHPVPAAEFQLVQQTAEQLVVPVYVRDAIHHTPIIPHLPEKTQPPPE